MVKLGERGPELIEVAAGIDPERDVLPLVGFPLLVSKSLRTMDSRILGDGAMGIVSKFNRGAN